MTKLKVSIIIPVYNTEMFLEKCLNSIVKQTYTELEIIIINDGSSDNSLEICKKYRGMDSRIILIDKNNEGVSSARNKGLEIATGEYIGFVDSDDFVKPEMFEKMIKVAIKEQADIVECGYSTCNLNGKDIKNYNLSNEIINNNLDSCFSYLSSKNSTNFNCNKIYRASIIKDIRYPNYKYSEDYWFNSHVFLNCNKKVTIADSLYYYVQNPNGAVSKLFDFEKKIDVFYAAEDVFNLYYNKFKALTSFVALYICNNVLNFYDQVNKNQLDIKMDQITLMSSLFKKYYPMIRGEALEKIKFKRLRIYLMFFNINPKLFLLTKKLNIILFKK